MSCSSIWNFGVSLKAMLSQYSTDSAGRFLRAFYPACHYCSPLYQNGTWWPGGSLGSLQLWKTSLWQKKQGDKWKFNDFPLHWPNGCPSYKYLKKFLLPQSSIYLNFWKIVSETQISEGSCSVTVMLFVPPIVLKL